MAPPPSPPAAAPGGAAAEQPVTAGAALAPTTALAATAVATATARRGPHTTTVKKRNGAVEVVSFDKVLQRLRKLAAGLDIDVDGLAKRVINSIFDGVETEKLDEVAAHICSSTMADHPHWGVLAARIVIDNHHKKTSPSFSETMDVLYANVDVHGKPCPLISEALHEITQKHKNKLNNHVNYKRDYLIDYFGMCTLMTGSYLMRIGDRVIERPQHMWMRVALGIHGDDVKAALETYDLMSTKRFTHASPTLFSAGSPTPQLSSCFVAGTPVYTLNAGVKPIEAVAVGDLVVTHLGRARPVAQTHANALGDRALVDLKVFKGPTITATEDHPFMSLTAEQARGGGAPGWNAAGALRVGDYVEIPRYDPGEAGAAERRLGDRGWKVDEPFCVLLGEWLADGAPVPDGNGDGIAFRVPTGDGGEKRDFLAAAGRAAFGADLASVGVLPDAGAGGGSSILFLESEAVADGMAALFGAPGRRRLPPEVHAWPTTLVRALLLGFGAVNLSRLPPAIEAEFGNIPDAALHKDVFNLVRSRGIVHHTKWSQGVKVVDGRTFLRVEAKTPSARARADNATVYTLGVEDDHSYAVDGVIAKNCFVAGTPVYTVNDGMKPIERVEIGDVVITHLGNAKPVVQTHANPLNGRMLYDFKVFNTPTITATENHEFMSITNEQAGWGKPPQWNKLGDLRVGDFIQIPSYKGDVETEPNINCRDVLRDVIGNGDNIRYVYTFDEANNVIHTVSEYSMERKKKNNEVITVNCKRTQASINLKWNVDESFCKFLGVWYGDGHVAHGRNAQNHSVPTAIGFTLHNANVKLKDFLVETGERVFGVKAAITLVKSQHVTQVIFNSIQLGFVFNKLFGHGFAGKRLYLGAHNWNTALVEALIAGLITSDGFVTAKGCIRIGMCNPSFVRDVYGLARSRGIPVSYIECTKAYVNTQGESRPCVVAYMTVPVNRARLDLVNKTYTDGRIKKYQSKKDWFASRAKVIDGRTFLRLDYKVPSTRTDVETVYTLGVEDDHSYAVDGIICVNCYLVASKGDSIDAIFSTIKEMALISKYAGGIGVHVSNIRAKGSKIRGTNGVADGLVPMLRLVNDTALYVNQGGGKRPGAIAVYLEPWHADIVAFLSLRKTSGNMKERCLDIFTAVWCPSLLVRRVLEDGPWTLFCPDESPGLADVWGAEFDRLYEGYEKDAWRARGSMPARELWKAICLAQVETGTPYLMYKDHANAKSNQQNLGTIKSSNLCVAPETLVLTSEGQLPIRELAEREGGRASVWNGKVFSDVSVRRTGVQQPLLTVSFDDGAELRCTPYHKFYIETDKSERTIVEAKDLTVSMRIVRYEVPTINLPAPADEGARLKHPYTQGLFAAVGTYDASEDGEPQCRANSMDDKPMLWLYGEKKKLIDHIDWLYSNADTTQDRLNVALPHDVADKYLVPVNHDIATKIRWLEGYLDGDGCVLQNNGAKNLQATSSNKPFFLQVKAMLQTLGINVAIKNARDAGMRSMPDGRGGRKEWRFNIDCAGVRHLVDLGYAPKRLVLGELRPPHHKTDDVFVAGVVDKEEVADTYCFNEPLEHAGIFNCIYSSQCSEIQQFSSPEETATCLTGDTPVLTERGAVRIDAVRPGDRVLAFFEGDDDFTVNQRFAGATLVDNGERDVVEVRIGTGKAVRATPDHRFLVHSFERGYEWREAAQLRPRIDRLVVPATRALPGYEESAGALDEYQWREAAQRLVMPATRALPGYEESEVGGAAADDVEWAISAGELASAVDHGLQRLWNGRTNAAVAADFVAAQAARQALQVQYKETVPQRIDAACARIDAAALPGPVAAAFLRGLFTARGKVWGRWGRASTVELGILRPAGAPLALPRVAELLLRFGIDATHEAIEGDADGSPGSEALTIEGLPALRLFCERVGFVECSENAAALDDAIAGGDPGLAGGAEEALGGDAFSRHGVSLADVVSVRPAGRARVYDLAVPDARHFVAAGVVAHNCNLASIALPSYVQPDGGYDYKELARIAGVITRNLNKVIDVNFYPVETARKSNLAHRPIGIGVQGLANVFTGLRIPYDSPEAADINRRIFATIYYGALDASCELAKRDGPYSSWAGCPASEGLLQYDLWGVKEPETCGGMLDWAALKARIAAHGLRNSLLVAPMPTASTSNILGFVESFEPYTSLFFTRRTLAGEFTVVAKELVDALLELGVWDDDMKHAILRNGGSVQGIEGVPADIQAVFKTVWEIRQKTMIDMAADRGAYICQSCSQNVYLADSDYNKLFNMHLYAHERGLKTSSYYVRTLPKVRTQAFTLPSAPPTRAALAAAAAAAAKPEEEEAPPAPACSRDNPGCVSCSG